MSSNDFDLMINIDYIILRGDMSGHTNLITFNILEKVLILSFIKLILAQCFSMHICRKNKINFEVGIHFQSSKNLLYMFTEFYHFDQFVG